jgi:hypothetical protein
MFLGFPGVGKTSLNMAFNGLAARFETPGFLQIGWTKSIYEVWLVGPNLLIRNNSNGKCSHLVLTRNVIVSRHKSAINVYANAHDTSVIELQFSSHMTAESPSGFEKDLLALSSLSPFNLEMRFELTDIAACDMWTSALHHWTLNSATTGISTSIKSLSQKEGQSPLEICYMDFAGHEEFVDFNVFFQY